MHDPGLRTRKRPQGNIFHRNRTDEPFTAGDSERGHRLYTAIIRRGNVTFLWRVKVYDSGPGGLSTKTALVCAEKAKRLWVRVSWQDRKGYAPYEAPGDFGEPQWTEHTFEELLDKAFQDTYIDSLDHPAIRDLMGWDV
jgi:hypothetical protein